MLDEHTAALDPKTAAKVLELTEKLVTEQRLTTLMITHNMRDALHYGNRLIMMHDGRPILDVRGEEKAKLTAVDLLQFFEKAGDGVSRQDLARLTFKWNPLPEPQKKIGRPGAADYVEPFLISASSTASSRTR